jgi:8-oxoguanine deaminase
VRTLLRASHVVGYQDGDHVVLRDAEVVYAGRWIEYVGHRFAGSVDRVIDAGRAAVSPGLIDLDALADVDHALIDSWQDPSTQLGLQWSTAYLERGPRDVFDPADVSRRRLYALAQLIRNGITTAMPIAAETHNAWAETYHEMADMADMARRLGLRMYLGPSYRSGVHVVDEHGRRDVAWRPEAGLAGVDAAAQFVVDVGQSDDDLVQGCLLPCRIETVTPEILARTRAIQDETGCLVRLHCLQSRTELAMLERWYRQDPLELLDELGLLGQRLLLPHGLHLGGLHPSEHSKRRDLELLAARRSVVVHCPLTVARYGGALDTFDSYRAAGVRLALGTDSFPPDLIRGMDFGTNVAKVLTGSISAGAAGHYFRAATLGGADALGRGDLGRLAPGARADLIVVDLNDPRVGPVDDPIRTMTMQADGTAVRTVVIDGRTVMEDRQIPGLDLAELHEWVQGYFAEMKWAYAERDVLSRGGDALFPGSFPTLAAPASLRSIDTNGRATVQDSIEGAS